LSNKINPEISVVMAVYNEERYIEKSISSILSQSFENFEFIIIDDGSTDNTKKIISSFDDSRIKLLITDHGGLPKALNIGISHSKSNLIARMDGDDIANEFRFEKQIIYLNNNYNCVAVGGCVKIIDKDGNFLYNQKMPLSDKKIRTYFPNIQLYHSSIIFRKDIYFKCGGYDEKLFTAQDQLLFNKMAKYGELVNIDYEILKYRIHPGALSRRSKSENQILSKSISNIINKKKSLNSNYDLINSIYLRNKNKKYLNKSLYYQAIGIIYIKNNFRRFYALKFLTFSVLINPFSIVSWFNLLLLVLPFKYIKIIKNS